MESGQPVAIFYPRRKLCLASLSIELRITEKSLHEIHVIDWAWLRKPAGWSKLFITEIVIWSCPAQVGCEVRPPAPRYKEAFAPESAF